MSSSQNSTADQALDMLSQAKDDKTALITLYRTLAKSDDKAFSEGLAERPNFWNNIFSLARDLMDDEEVVMAVHFFLDKGSKALADKTDSSPYVKNFCSAAHKNLILDTVVSQLLWLQCDVELEGSVVKAVSRYLHCLAILNNEDSKAASGIIFDSFLTLKSGGFLTTLTTILENGPQYEQEVETMAQSCVKVLARLHWSLHSQNIDRLSSQWLNSMVDLLDKHFKLKELAKTNDESREVGGKQISELSLVNAIDLITFCKDSNLSFRKKYSERLLFEDDAFPIVKGLSWLSDQLARCFHQFFAEEKFSVFIMQCFLNKDILIYSLVDKLMELWIESNAQDFADFGSVLETFEIAFFQHDNFLGAKEPDIGACLVNIRSLTYADLRSMQLKQLRSIHYKKWETQVSHFDSMLSNQVLEFVRHQRLLQLQKGAWVYSDNPLDRSVKQPRVYFIILSDNQMNLLAKEYRLRSEQNPAVNGNEILSTNDSSAPKSKTVVIPLRRVHKFQHWRVQSESKVPENSKLINILNKAVYTEIHLLDKEANILLKFYVDTKEASYIWLDGLQLLVAAAQGKTPTLSEELKSQVASLIDLRKNVQIIGLDDKTDLTDNIEDSTAEDEFYDLETLQSVTADFHYD
ncbi:LAFA_0B02608g1_1 [Lachancea sp. 'fantastica']|nr:LAFA_0B02608g1_1 [Lachancea sp. 'fantastica']